MPSNTNISFTTINKLKSKDTTNLPPSYQNSQHPDLQLQDLHPHYLLFNVKQCIGSEIKY